ncbi:hypothetical protein Rsub_06679 [Raphidocelis subcapitata]|uniref:TLC domain-containing protein n=1 Tax=Raphidocelis subcapitata TaxID=307507 RepID=A0A2V0P3X4_9CHLO|nr:hypothetical protein Rsub_06679 [Raphidocelis subcapitata]|eukprot:GBF94564.1 hypothetical protein Rsub_06679 [Raphidocelis subcapitata]
MWRPLLRHVQPQGWDPVMLHDVFNLVALGALNALNAHFILGGGGFELFWTSCMVYFLIDTAFVGIYPQSVKSPVVILSHHLVTAVYMLIPYHYPKYQWCMAACMTVEVNTWLLIARRVIGGPLIEAAFYVTWILLRNVYYPYLIWAFYGEWRAESRLCGSPWNPILATPCMQAFLSGLNLHWSVQLFKKRPRRGPGAGQGGGGTGGGGGGRGAGGEPVAKYNKHL